MIALSIDDDPLIGETLSYFADKAERIERCVHARDAGEALKLLGERTFDLVLLDLHLPDGSGRSVLEGIPARVPVVMVTSDPAFGADSYRFVNVVDYLLKPLDYVRFHQAVERAWEFRARSTEGARIPGAEKSIFVKSGSEVVRLVLAELRFLKAEANYVSLHGKGTRPVMVLSSLTKVLELLPAGFLRVHRSYAVNRDHIERVEGGSVIVAGDRIPLGDSYRAEFLERLKVAL